MTVCLSLLPNAGLGNKLFVFAHGAVFASQNGCEHISLPWSHLSLRSILNGRRPLYGLDIKLQDYRPLVTALLRCRTSVVINPPPGAILERHESQYSLVIFNQIPHWRDYFAQIRNHRKEVKSALVSLVRFVPPTTGYDVAIHIRRGDFSDYNPTRPFEEQGCTKAPLAYFRDIAMKITTHCGFKGTVGIFSDARDDEIDEVLSVSGVSRARARSDLEELFLMSCARLIVASPSSTFSLWAGFLGDGALIHHPDHFHQNVRLPSDGLEVCWSEDLDLRSLVEPHRARTVAPATSALRSPIDRSAVK